MFLGSASEGVAVGREGLCRDGVSQDPLEAVELLTVQAAEMLLV